LSLFFVMPVNCGKVLYSASNVKFFDQLNDKRMFSKKLYNYFICTKGVALFEKGKNKVKETFVFYDDKDFLKKLPDNPYDFYKKALEKYLKKAKKNLQKGQTVYLYFNGYEFEISKHKFIVYKNNQKIVQNFLSDIKYSALGEVILNPYTDKKIRFYAHKTVYEFFKYYYGIAKFKMYDKNVKRKNDFLLLFYGVLNLLVFLSAVFGIMFLFWYVDVLVFKEFSAIRAVIEGIVAIALGEFISDVFKSKVYY